MKDKDFLNFIREVEPEYNDEDLKPTEFLDSGSYALNALASGSIYGGFASNKVTAFSGESGVGKSFFAMSALKAFQEKNKKSYGMYFDSEFALDPEFLRKRGIDAKQVGILTPQTLQEFRTKALQILTNYEKMETKVPMMLILDSLSNLPSAKEIEDGLEGKDVRDMTKNQLIRSIFRSITTKLGKLNVPLFVCSHVYSVIGAYVPTNEISGGGGLKYAASSILAITKKKDKDGTDVIGNILKVETYKSRYSKANQKIELKLDFNKGLDRYYGLLELGEKYDIFKKVSTRYEINCGPDTGKRVWGKDINENPTEYYNEEVLAALDKAAFKEYSLGETANDIIETIEEE